MNFYSLDDIPEHLQQYFQPAPQIGLEPTVSEYVDKMVQVFRGVRRVLRDDGTAWVVLGDSYAASAKGQGGIKNSTLNAKRDDNGYLSIDGKSQPMMVESFKMDLAASGLKPKDLIGIPWRVAFALQADGWYLRSDIIWHKPNPMPESVTDRPTKAHEYLFLLAKSERYYYDSEAIKEQAVWAESWSASNTHTAVAQGGRHGKTSIFNQRWQGKAGKNAFRGQGAEREGATGPANRDGRDMQDVGAGATRNKRSVWTVATRPYKEAHFATYPVELIQPCILAGCPEGGVVLDPFNGAATTGVAAIGLGRDYIGLELNPEYVQLSNRRLSNTQPALIGVTA